MPGLREFQVRIINKHANDVKPDFGEQTWRDAKTSEVEKADDVPPFNDSTDEWGEGLGGDTDVSVNPFAATKVVDTKKTRPSSLSAEGVGVTVDRLTSIAGNLKKLIHQVLRIGTNAQAEILENMLKEVMKINFIAFDLHRADGVGNAEKLFLEQERQAAVILELKKIADALDSEGLQKEADIVDNVMLSLVGE